MQGRKERLEEGKEKEDMMLIWYNLKIVILKVCQNSNDRRIDLFLHFFKSVVTFGIRVYFYLFITLE